MSVLLVSFGLDKAIALLAAEMNWSISKHISVRSAGFVRLGKEKRLIRVAKKQRISSKHPEALPMHTCCKGLMSPQPSPYRWHGQQAHRSQSSCQVLGRTPVGVHTLASQVQASGALEMLAILLSLF